MKNAGAARRKRGTGRRFWKKRSWMSKYEPSGARVKVRTRKWIIYDDAEGIRFELASRLNGERRVQGEMERKMNVLRHLQ